MTVTFLKTVRQTKMKINTQIPFEAEKTSIPSINILGCLLFFAFKSSQVVYYHNRDEYRNADRCENQAGLICDHGQKLVEDVFNTAKLVGAFCFFHGYLLGLRSEKS